MSIHFLVFVVYKLENNMRGNGSCKKGNVTLCEDECSCEIPGFMGDAEKSGAV